MHIEHKRRGEGDRENAMGLKRVTNGLDLSSEIKDVRA